MRHYSILAIALLITACASTGNVIKEQPVKIGGAFILSGIGSDWGEIERNAAQLAVADFNEAHGTNVKLIIESTSYENKKTLLAVQKLASIDDVPLIIGPTWLGGLQGAAAAAEESGTILITPSDTITAIKHDQDYPNSFSTWYRADEETEALAKYLAQMNLTRVAIFYGNDPFWVDFKEKMLAAADKQGLKIVSDLTFGPHQREFQTELLKLKEAKPQVVLFGLDDEAGFQQFLRQRQIYTPDLPSYGTELIEGFTANEEYKGLLQGIRFIAPAAANPAFSAKYEKAYGVKPQFSAVNTYDATMIGLQALFAGNNDAQTIREYLHTHEFNTYTFGKVHFDSIGGITGGEFVIKEIDENNAVHELN